MQGEGAESGDGPGNHCEWILLCREMRTTDVVLFKGSFLESPSECTRGQCRREEESEREYGATEGRKSRPKTGEEKTTEGGSLQKQAWRTPDR